MRQAEARVGASLATYLPDQLNGVGHDGAFTILAHDLGVSKATLGYWMLKLGIRMEDVAVRSGDRVYAVAADGSERLLLEVH